MGSDRRYWRAVWNLRTIIRETCHSASCYLNPNRLSWSEKISRLTFRLVLFRSHMLFLSTNDCLKSLITIISVAFQTVVVWKKPRCSPVPPRPPLPLRPLLLSSLALSLSPLRLLPRPRRRPPPRRLQTILRPSPRSQQLRHHQLSPFNLQLRQPPRKVPTVTIRRRQQPLLTSLRQPNLHWHYHRFPHPIPRLRQPQ